MAEGRTESDSSALQQHKEEEEEEEVHVALLHGHGSVATAVGVVDNGVEGLVDPLPEDHGWGRPAKSRGEDEERQKKRRWTEDREMTNTCHSTGNTKAANVRVKSLYRLCRSIIHPIKILILHRIWRTTARSKVSSRTS